MSIARDHPLSAPSHHPSFDLFCHRRRRRRNHRLLLRSKMKSEPYRNRVFFLKTEPKSTDLAKCETVTTLQSSDKHQPNMRMHNYQSTLIHTFSKSHCLTSDISICPLFENDPSPDGPPSQSPYCSSSSNQNRALLFANSLKCSFSDMNTYISYNTRRSQKSMREISARLSCPPPSAEALINLGQMYSYTRGKSPVK